MRHVVIFTLAILYGYTALAQIVKRGNKEDIEIFANRFKPDSTILAHQVIEINMPNTSQKVVLAFYKKTIYEARQEDTYVDHSEYNIIVGYLFIPQEGGYYKRKMIDTIQPDGGDAEIIAVFFANADKNKDKELVVLCKYDQVHYDYGGTLYETFIYKYEKENTQLLKKLSESFLGCECSWNDGRIEKAKYKTAKDIRASLERMGYKQ